MNRLCKKCDSHYVEEGDLCEQCMSQSDSTITRKDYAKAVAKMYAMVKSGEITNEQMRQRLDGMKATMVKQDPTTSAIKKLWQYAVFRWCLYHTPLLVCGILASNGAFDNSPYRIRHHMNGYPWRLGDTHFRDYATLIWILIFALPAVWVWRRPIWKLVKQVWKQVWKLVKQALGFLNKKAEEG